MAFPSSFSGKGSCFNGNGNVGKGGDNASFLPGGNFPIHSEGNQSGASQDQQVRCLACGQANHALNPYCGNCRAPLPKTVIQWGQCDSQDTGNSGSPLTPAPPRDPSLHARCPAYRAVLPNRPHSSAVGSPFLHVSMWCRQVRTGVFDRDFMTLSWKPGKGTPVGGAAISDLH